MTIWNDVLDKIWIDELLHQANVLGQRSDTGFKKCAFLAALSKLNQSPGLKKPFTMAQLRSRNEVKKGEFSIVHKMATASGMGWEDSTCRVICTGTTWDAYFEENKKTNFGAKLTTDDMAIAFEVMENSTKARLFLHMQGKVRDVWLRRQIRVQAS
ncbi:unnamed protein product [Aphanomyces euteiches]